MGKLKGRGLRSRISSGAGRLMRKGDPDGGSSVERVSERGGPRRSRNWYSTARWKQLRRRIIVEQGGVCQMTGVRLIGRFPDWNSPVVDHRVPHRGDEDLFFDESNLQLVSKEWHDKVKQSREKNGGS